MKPLKVKDVVLAQGRPKIAALITGKNHDEIIKQVTTAKKMPCELLEWRADYFFGAMDELEEKIHNTVAYKEMIRILDDIDYATNSMPLILTLKGNSVGGKVKISREDAYDLVALAAQSKLVDFVDMELLDDNGTYEPEQVLKQVKEIRSFGVRVIHSYHEYDKTLSLAETVNVAESMRTMGADIVKIVTAVNTDQEAEKLLDATKYLTRENNNPVIIIGMGTAGKKTRISGGRYGSCITFAYLDKPTAEGQFEIKTLSKILDKYYKKPAK